MTQPIRVLQIFTILNRGGAETMIMNYYRHIDRSRLQFDFLVCRPEKGAYEDEIEAMGGRIYRIPPLLHVRSHRTAVRRFFTEHPEYRIIHGHVGELGYFIYKEAQRTGVRCVIAHAHNSFCDKDWKLPLRYLLKYLIRKYVSHTMACGYSAACWYFGKKLGAKATILNNAIEAEKFRFDRKKYERTRELMGWQNRWVIGNVARFSPQKNHHFLIKLFSRVLKRRPSALLVLVGDTRGDVYESVKREVETLRLGPYVQFLGSRRDVPDLLQGMDVFCFPSLYEGFGIAILEAEASGLRVIKSSCVPDDANAVPDLVKALSLKAPLDAWVKALLAPYERRDTYAEICQAGFDIAKNALWLQQFYLDQASTKD